MSVPINIPLLSGNEKKYLNECIDSGWISSEGPFVERFENEFSDYIGMKYGIAVSNGSSALDIAVEALGLKKGDEVIMPTFTIISPAFSIVRSGALPVLVDSKEDTWNMNVDLIEEKITSRTKAILVVHIYGLPVEMNKVLELCKKYNLYLIEDAAEMHGQEYNGKKCGSFGDISTFSFYPNKHITTGEGGMILTNSELLQPIIRKLKNLSFEPDKPRFVHYDMGWNCRMTNMQAALGVAQLEQIENHIKKKRQIGKEYLKYLEKLEGFQLPIVKTDYSDNIYWVFGLLAKTEEEKNIVTRKLNNQKIGTRPFFWCMHEQPVFIKMGLFTNDKYPVAEKLARNGFYIPSGLGTTLDQVKEVANVLLNL